MSEVSVRNVARCHVEAVTANDLTWLRLIAKTERGETVLIDIWPADDDDVVGMFPSKPLVLVERNDHV